MTEKWELAIRNFYLYLQLDQTLRKLTEGNLLQTCSISCNTCLCSALLQNSTTAIPVLRKLDFSSNLSKRKSKIVMYNVLTRWGYKVSETFIARDENQVWTEFHVLNIFSTLLFELHLSLKQCPPHFLISWNFSDQHLVILNRSF